MSERWPARLVAGSRRTYAVTATPLALVAAQCARCCRVLPAAELTRREASREWHCRQTWVCEQARRDRLGVRDD